MQNDHAQTASSESSGSSGTEPGRKALDGSSRARGVVPIKFARITAFAVISLAIFACAVLCILAVWDFAARDNAWRAFASLGIISAAMISFVIVNEVFGRALGPNKPLRQ